MRPLLALPLLLAPLVLAGCMDTGPRDTAAVQAPAWEAGDMWRWREPDLIVTGGPFQGGANETHDIIWVVNGTTTVAGVPVWEVLETGEKNGAPFGDPDVFYKAVDTQELVNESGRMPSLLKFPFTVGTSYRTGDGEDEIRVLPREPVSTPAGNFSAYRLERWSALPNGTLVMFHVLYYAPEAGNVVRWETHYGGGQFSVRELVAFRFQGASRQ